MAGRYVVLAASVGSLLVSASCLPIYVWNTFPGDGDEDSNTADGAGEDGAGGSGGGGGGTTSSGGSECGLPPGRFATNGPFGAEQLYFGDPEIDASLSGPYKKLGGSVSPDGLHFIQGWSGQRVLETPRQGVFASWEAESYPPDYTHHELHPRLSQTNHALYTCHGGEMKCMYHTRIGTGPDAQLNEAFHFMDVPPFDGSASDFAFTPTPDGQFLAFASNRVSARDDSDGAADLDLWIAKADEFDPFIPPRNYTNLVKLTTSAAGMPEEPSWISDDALTLVFSGARGREQDLFIVERADADAPFGVEVKLPFSQPDITEQDFSMPSIATLEATGCGFAYYEVTAPAALRAWMRVPVCVGAPCEP